MSIDITKLAEYLAATLNDDNTIRQSAEEKLTAFSANTQEYFAGLVQLILLSHPDITNQIKNAAALSLKKLMKETVDGVISKEQRIFYANNIFSALISNGLDSPLRGALGYALVPVFSGQSEVITAFLPTLITAISSETCNLLGSIKAIKSIYSGFVYNPVLYPFFKKVLPSLIMISSRAISNLNQAILNNNNALALESSEIIYEWASTINSIFEYFDISSKDTLDSLKDISELPEAFKEVAGIVVPNPEIMQPLIISLSGNNVGIKINHAKTQVFQSINIVIQYLLDNKRAENGKIVNIGSDMPDSPYLNVVSDMLPVIVSSLEFISFKTDTDLLLELENISELFIELLLIMQKLCTDNRFNQYFIENYSHIIVNLCLPLIKCTPSDIETFEESPDEFVALSSDICERQESETVKSTVASLLETLCGRIDGSLRYLIMFSSSVIDWTIRQNPLTEYTLLSEFSNSKTLQLNEELRIETSCISLCIVSYIVAKRRDLQKIIEKLFVDHLNSLYMKGTGLIKNRLCMLIHYYAEYLFTEEEVAFRSLLLIILDCCDPQKTSTASVNIQASETLSHMLQEESILMRIYTYIPDVISSLIRLIDHQSSKAFFEALQEIITENVNLVIPHLTILVPGLVAKVIQETNLRKNKKSKNSLITVKCWNIIRTLIECKTLTDPQVLELERQFVQLFEYIKNPKEIEFDDDIILFEVSVMRRCKIVTEIGWSLFPSLKLVQAKYDNTFVQLFQILNCYIAYGANVLSGNIQMIKAITEMCGDCLVAVYKKKVNEATNAEGALIFHQILYTFKGQLNDLLPSILAYAIHKLSTPIRNNFFKARILGIILASFTYDTLQTIQVLKTSITPSRQSYFDYVFSEISSNTQIFKHPYDKKVAISGLCSFFNHPSLQGSFNIIFQIIIEILSNSWRDSLPLKPELKLDDEAAIMKLNETLKDFNSEEMEANLALTTFLNPLDTFDEYEYFRELVKGFQQADLAILVRGLNQVQVGRLTSILQSKRVQIGTNPSQTDVRRIVKPKNKLQN